jgi:hypothetical protein
VSVIDYTLRQVQPRGHSKAAFLIIVEHDMYGRVYLMDGERKWCGQLENGVSRSGYETALDVAEALMEATPPCQAFIWHGPGHQSDTRCHVEGEHEIHEAIYGSERQLARWRDGDYTSKLREQGIEFNPESYPENIAMSGFFDEPPEFRDEDR